MKKFRIATDHKILDTTLKRNQIKLSNRLLTHREGTHIWAPSRQSAGVLGNVRTPVRLSLIVAISFKRLRLPIIQDLYCGEMVAVWHQCRITPPPFSLARLIGGLATRQIQRYP